MVQHLFHWVLDNGSEVQLVFDVKKSTIHVLEQECADHTTIMDNVQDTKESLIRQIETYDLTCRDVIWFFYGTHGEVLRCAGGSSEPMNLDHPDLNKNFVNKLKCKLVSLSSFGRADKA